MMREDYVYSFSVFEYNEGIIFILILSKKSLVLQNVYISIHTHLKIDIKIIIRNLCVCGVFS